MLYASLAGHELSGGDVQEGYTAHTLAEVYGGQKVVLLARKHHRSCHCPRFPASGRSFRSIPQSQHCICRCRRPCQFSGILSITDNKRQLDNEHWDVDSASGPRVVDVYMTKIRDKFSECDSFEIVTVHGLGYKAVIK